MIKVIQVWKSAKLLAGDHRKLLSLVKQHNNILYVWHEAEFGGYHVKIREHLDDEFRLEPDGDLAEYYEPISLWSEVNYLDDDNDAQALLDESNLCGLLEELDIQLESWGEVPVVDQQGV